MSKKSSPRCFSVYTDGGCTYNPGPLGSFSFLILTNVKNHSCVVCSTTQVVHDKNLTNNQMELIACLNSIQWLLSNYTGNGFTIEMYSDSQYVCNCFNETMKRHAKNNENIWLAMDALKLKLKKRLVKCNLNWIKGHSINTYNLHVDKNLNLARNFFKSKVSRP